MTLVRSCHCRAGRQALSSDTLVKVLHTNVAASLGSNTPQSQARGDAARARFKNAIDAVAAERHFDPKLAELSDIELLEAATTLTLKK